MFEVIFRVFFLWRGVLRGVVKAILRVSFPCCRQSLQRLLVLEEGKRPPPPHPQPY